MIIVPAALRLMWAEELEKWLPGIIRPSDIHLIEGRATRLDKNKELPLITITSYEMASRLTCKACKEAAKELGEATKKKETCACESGECLASMGFNFVLVDEAHNLRTSANASNRAEDTDKAKASSAIALKSTHAVFLTGTPSLSKPHDLYRQVATLDRRILMDRDSFEFRYCDKRLVPKTGFRRGSGDRRWDVSGGSRLLELHGLLTREVMIRRLKKDVALQLPPKRRQVIRLPEPPPDKWPDYIEKKGKKGPKKEEEDDSSESEEESDDVDPAPSRMSRVHKTGLAKIDSVIDWILDALGAPTG